MVERIAAFKASDGTIFEHFDEADKHQAELDFFVWYENNEIYAGREGSKLDGRQLLDWLRENRDHVLPVL